MTKIYTAPKTTCGVNIFGCLGSPITKNIETKIKPYIIDHCTYFLGCDEDDLCKITTKTDSDALQVASIISEFINDKDIYVSMNGEFPPYINLTY